MQVFMPTVDKIIGMSSKLFGGIYESQLNARQVVAALLFRLSGDRRSELNIEPKRVLFVCTGLIGDTIMCTPVLAAARSFWPNAQFTLLGQPHNCDLLRASPIIDSLFETGIHPFSIGKRSQKRKLLNWCKSKQFDLSIILLGDHFAILPARAGIPVRVGVRGRLLDRCNTHLYDMGSPRVCGPSERLNSLRCLGYVIDDEPQPMLWVEPQARISAIHRLAKLGLPPGVRYVAFHPFGSTRRQWWPVERVASVADELWRIYGLRVVLLGGKNTQEFASKSLGVHVINSVGQLTLPELLGVIESAFLVISTDSGPYHIAGALKRPLIGLFRARRPEHAKLYLGSHVIFGEDATCHEFCSWDMCRETPCCQLLSISVKQLLDMVKRFNVELS